MNTLSTLDQFAAWELEAFAEGVHMPHIQQFVQDHPDLWAAWLQSYRQAQQPYQALARFDCPAPAQLQAYYWNQLAKSAGSQIERHLQVCTSCAEELQALNRFLADELPQESPQPAPTWPKFNLGARVQEFTERVRTLVASFVPPLLPELAPVAFRNGEQIPALQADRPATLLFTAEDLDISLVALKEADDHLFLSGQVLSDREIVAGRVKLTPENAAAPEVEALLDDAGAFVLNNLQPGYYHLTLTTAERAVVVPNILIQ